MKLDFSKGIGKLWTVEKAKPGFPHLLKPAGVERDIMRELESVEAYCLSASKNSRDVNLKVAADFCSRCVKLLRPVIKHGDSTAIEYAYKLGRFYERLRSTETTRRRRRKTWSVPVYIESIQGWKTKPTVQLLGMAEKEFPDRDRDNFLRQIHGMKNSDIKA